MKMSSSLPVSSASAIGLTLAIAFILLASNFTVINAQLPPSQQQQVQSDGGGLTATLNGARFTTGETITVSGSIEQRGPGSNVAIEVINPQGEIVKYGFPPVASDNTFSYSFVAGEQEQSDPNAPMLMSGNYSMVVRYFIPSEGVVIEEVELLFGYNGTTTAVVEPEEADAATTTRISQQPAEIENRTAAAATLFQSTNDSFSVQVPQGWIIYDINNTGSALLEETRLGYGILAQLCPEGEEEQQQGAAFSTNSSDSTNNTSSNNSCQRTQEEVVHVIRYPDLERRIQPANNITTYHLQKLQEVGYTNIRTVNSTDMIVNLTIHRQTKQ
jgi:hypothetical protein